MEFEIDETIVEEWMIETDGGVSGNRAPGWCGDAHGATQTGVWIPEEGRTVSAKRLEPVG